MQVPVVIRERAEDFRISATSISLDFQQQNSVFLGNLMAVSIFLQRLRGYERLLYLVRLCSSELE